MNKQCTQINAKIFSVYVIVRLSGLLPGAPEQAQQEKERRHGEPHPCAEVQDYRCVHTFPTAATPNRQRDVYLANTRFGMAREGSGNEV